MDIDARQNDGTISVVLTDVDGTLVTKDKILTERAIRAVRQLRERGIIFTVTSGRPPFGMRMLVEPLGLTMPMAAYNGGVIVFPDLSVLDERLLPEYMVPALIDIIEAHGLDIFVFRSSDWYVRSEKAPRVDRESTTIQRRPKVVPNFEGALTGVVKIVGVSEDHPRVAACEAAVQSQFGTVVTAVRSTPQYLDVTHPTANKGVVADRLSRYLNIPLARMATIGDQLNDVLMFKKSGLSIAMGNASDEVKRQASCVTTSFGEEGFANAIEQFVLPRAQRPGGPAVKPTGQLHRLGQSLWLDHLTRDLLDSGALENYIHELSVTGVTASPADFATAIKTGSAYDSSIRRLAPQGKAGEELFVELVLEDLTRAAGLLRPIWEQTAGMDGWVSLEVLPPSAGDAAAKVAAAKTLFARAGCPNFMIDIPGTAENIPAVEEAIAAGIPVNVTLLFSREHYLAAAEAFLRGIERRIDAGLKPDIVSVASVYARHWDTTAADAPAGGSPARPRPPELGIAMAKRTYKVYRGLLGSPRWQRIYNAGARTQRLLWAGAGSNDPVADVLGIKAMAAQFTITAMPEETLRALAHGGDITTLLRADGGDCEEVVARCTAAGINPYEVASKLQVEAARMLMKSWNELMTVIAAKAGAVVKAK